MSAGTAYAKRYPGGWVDLPTKTTPIDKQFLDAVEAALLQLIGQPPTADGQVAQWDNANTRFGPALLLNKNIDPAAAIAKSKLDLTGANGIVDADISGAAAIARSKLNFGAGLVNADIAAAAAIDPAKILGGGGTAGLFSAYRSGTDFTMTVTSGYQAIVFNTEEFDVSGWYDAATGIFTPQIAGYYLLAGNVWYKTPMTDGERIGASIFKNASQHKNLYFGHQSGSDLDTNRIGGAAIVHANGTTDNFYFGAYSNHGSSILLGADQPSDTWFAGHLIARG